MLVYSSTFVAYAMSHFSRKCYTNVKAPLHTQGGMSKELLSRKSILRRDRLAWLGNQSSEEAPRLPDGLPNCSALLAASVGYQLHVRLRHWLLLQW